MTLPQFQDRPEPALELAQRAEAAGLDGVFVFDHLWPLGRPDRPALSALPLLGALAVETRRLWLGSLVARVSLLADAVLVNAFRTLHRVLGDRLVAGLGTGDRSNREENLVHGVPYPGRAARLASVEACARALEDTGVRTWVGGLSPEIRRVAAATASGWNGWGSSAGTFAAHAQDLRDSAGPRRVEATWGGQVLIGRSVEEAAEKRALHGDRPGLVHGTVDDLERHLDALESAGATWAICAPLDLRRDPRAVELLGEVATRRR